MSGHDVSMKMDAKDAIRYNMDMAFLAGGADDSRPVRYCLRSDKWREAMFNNGKADLEKHKKALIELIEEVSA